MNIRSELPWHLLACLLAVPGSTIHPTQTGSRCSDICGSSRAHCPSNAAQLVPCPLTAPSPRPHADARDVHDHMATVTHTMPQPDFERGQLRDWCSAPPSLSSPGEG